MKPIRLLLLFLSFCPLAVYAQTAEVGGAVQDPSGAVIPKASVEFRNQDTGVRRQTTTNNDGYYRITGMDPGKYDATVQAKGFKTLTRENVTFQVGDKAQIDFKMQVGQADQSITVDGSGLQINTTDASVSTVIDQKFVQNTPLNGRSFQDLISLTPGVVTQSPQTTQALGFNGDFSVNGQRTESNYYIVDGVSGNVGAGNGHGQSQPATGGGLAGSTALGTTQSLVSVDALQEFRVQSSSYSAEFGRGPGGQFSFATRSGTNSFHGSVFDYLRNNFFDANDWFSDHYRTAQPALRQNDFGGTLGGPFLLPKIYDGHNRTFFFLSYEGLRLTQPQAASLQYVPSLSLRQSVPSALQPILNAFPVPTGPELFVACDNKNNPCPPGSVAGTPVPSGMSSFTQGFSVPSHIDSTSVRLDHTFAQKLSIFFRYANTPSTSYTRSLSSLTRARVNTQTYTFGATDQLTTRANNEFRLGYTSVTSSLAETLDHFGGAVATDLANALGAGGSPYPYAYFVFQITGIGSSSLITTTSNNLAHQWNAVDNYSLTLGNHQIKLGVDYRRIVSPLNPSSLLIQPLAQSRQSLLNNQISLVATTKHVGAEPVFNEIAAFAQDNWRLGSRLSLALGLRWEFNPPPHDLDGNDPYTLLGNISAPGSLSLASRGTPLWKAPVYNFAPRVGLAWQAHTIPQWETVVRVGSGVFFDTDNSVASLGYSGVGFSATKLLSSAPLPITPAQLDYFPSTSAPYTSTAVYAFPHHLQLPYTLQWNVSIQQAMGKNRALTISYVGANGRRLMQEQQLSLSSLNPNFGTVYYFPGGVTSNYQALETQFQQSVGRGVQALASYTWSHSIDVGSSASALPIQRGNSDFDVRSNLSAGLSWELPSKLKSTIPKIVLSHWGIDGRLIARTGFPITLNGNTLIDPGTGNKYLSGVNWLPSRPLYLYGPQYPGGRAINGGPNALNPAFTLPAGNASGNAPRNFVRGFGENQLNLAMRRDFPIRESLALHFRAEAFNILNHPNFGYIDPTLIDATFGQATNMLNQSLTTVASQYQQGGPRSLQFALRLTF